MRTPVDPGGPALRTLVDPGGPAPPPIPKIFFWCPVSLFFHSFYNKFVNLVNYWDPGHIPPPQDFAHWRPYHIRPTNILL